MGTPLRLLAAALAFASAAPAAPWIGAGDQGARDAQLSRFRELLHELRRGGEAAGELAEVADRLCHDHGRCDARAVASFYARLTPAERTRGLEDESRFLHLRQRLFEAGMYGLPAEGSWPQLRAELRAELLELAEGVEAEADFTPAARAWALLAVLDVEEVEQAVLDPPEEAQLLERAERRARRSLELFTAAGQATPRLEPLWVVGRIERARGRPSAARSSFESCLALARQVDNDAFRERALFGLAAMARDAGDVAAVDRALVRVASFRSPAESWPLAREHAMRLVHSDRPETALAFLLRYEPLEASYTHEWHSLLATAFLRSGDLDAARREVEAMGDEGSQLGVLARASLQLAEGEPQRVVDVLEPLISSGAWSFQARAEACSLLGEAWLALEHPGRAAPWLDEALQRADAWQRLQRDAASGSVVGEWLGLHTVVLAATAATRLGDPLEAARIIEEYHGRRLRPDDDLGRDAVGAEDLRAWASAFDDGLVTWAVGADASVVAHVGRDGDAWSATLPLGRRAFEGAVRRLREAALGGEPTRLAALAQEIATTLFPVELRQRLEARGGRVLLLPHGPLEALPFALLDYDGRPFDDTFTALVLPGLPPAAPGDAPRRAPAAWVLAGDARPSPGGPPALPGAARELATLARRHPSARVLRGDAFTRTALLGALADATSLHVAAHLVATDACADARMASVGIELGDGDVLCASEILAAHPSLDLVVLSACESGGGRPIDAEGLHGVARAFLEAGARDVLVTLWPVEDDAARLFGVAFHAALEAGFPPAAAARAGRLELRARGRAPADWAAFRLMGRD